MFGLKVVDSILDAIGDTPLVELRRLVPAGGGQLWAKLESHNPGGSVKDRIGVRMIRDAQERGALRQGMTIVESTSGNTGIALAMAAAALGYPLVLTMPESMSLERRQVMASYGARIVLTPAAEDMAGAIRKAEELKARDPEGVFMPQQFGNPANPEAHRRTTAREILEATGGQLDAFVAGVGTGGTITGVGEVLKAQVPGIHIAAVEPARSPVLAGGKPGLHGIQGIGAGFVPAVLSQAVVDEVVAIEDEDAFHYTRRLAREEGLLVGPSSGANVAAALQVAQRLGPGKRLVTMLCDTGFRYFSVAGLKV
ncbi:MAG: cysteine synthase A [Candidatus Handelsmanbacteria bacterium]|nr:cysteine synthase A [Candidatus Handelsmanbacteria bacterium]